MRITVEISLYPMTENYDPLIFFLQEKVFLLSNLLTLNAI
jgi:hypothetical protein